MHDKCLIDNKCVVWLVLVTYDQCYLNAGV